MNIFRQLLKKIKIFIFRLDISCRYPCGGQGQKDSSESCWWPHETSLPSWSSFQQHFRPLCWPMCTKSIGNISAPPFLVYLMQVPRELFLQYPCHVLRLGQTETLPIRESRKGEGVCGVGKMNEDTSIITITFWLNWYYKSSTFFNTSNLCHCSAVA